MGQAWCKDKSSQIQDSKSPLDRVFLRCAHRIYPGLKEEGSVLGGATQRVTSSEIGYAGSPSRTLLTRARSIDSTDRPFQPSDWVDVNLEVPSTPRAISVMTNLTMDTSTYPITTSSSIYSNLQDIPIPPPRRKKKNCPRPLPPKPNDISDNYHDTNSEPLYSSVIPRTRNNYMKKQSENDEYKRTNDIYEYTMNGTGKVISSKVVSAWKSAERISSHQKSPEVCNNRLKNTSTVSLPNYDELEASKPEIASEKISNSILNSEDSFEYNRRFFKSIKKGIELNEIEKNQIGSDEVNVSLDLIKELKVETTNTSTPIRKSEGEFRNPIKVDSWFLHADRSTRYPDSPVVNKYTKSDLESRAWTYLSFDELKLLNSDPSHDVESDKKTNSLDRYKDMELKKIHRRTLSSESEPFDSFDEKRLNIEPNYRGDSSPKLLTKSISEESFPSALMEDPDEVDFFDEKIVKDTKNEITKIREELEAVKNEVKTPPPSPEPIIKPEFQNNDHLMLLKVVREETDESNLSSMTPSLTELEAALSDMLEKEEDQENVNMHMREGNCKSSAIIKSLEKLIEPKIVPFIAEEVPRNMVDIDLPNGKFVNNLPQIIDTSTEDLKSLDLSRLKNNYSDAPEKPTRIHKNSSDSLNSSGSIPTPPRRRNRSSSGGPKDNFLLDCHSNDRLI